MYQERSNTKLLKTKHPTILYTSSIAQQTKMMVYKKTPL